MWHHRVRVTRQVSFEMLKSQDRFKIIKSKVRLKSQQNHTDLGIFWLSNFGFLYLKICHRDNGALLWEELKLFDLSQHETCGTLSVSLGTVF